MEENRIQNQIAIYMTNKKLCEFTDKLKPAPVEYYAHMHAQGEELPDGFRAYSCIGVVLQDYSRLSTFYIDLVEYLVMTVRLYFFIREKQFRPIDRGKYDELVGVRAALPTPA